MHCLRPAVIAETARDFVEAFPGDVLYAVKCNPDPAVLRALWDGGVRHFDCASLPEIRLVRDMFPDAAIHFMHPVKARGAIREAWERHGVRDFVLDSADELAKIRAEIAATGVPGALGLIVRLALPKGGAELDLSGKFGAEAGRRGGLLRAARRHAARLGVSFHVGSQCLDPLAWRDALALAGAGDPRGRRGGRRRRCRRRLPGRLSGPGAAAAGRVLRRDRGGVRAPGPAAARGSGRSRAARWWPAGASVVVQVQARRGDALYVNDGVYGSLSDAGALGLPLSGAAGPSGRRASRRR